MITVFEYPKKRAEFEAFLAANPVHQLHVNGGEMMVLTGDDMPIVLVPDRVTPRQIRLALNASGLRPTVESAVAAGNQDLKDWWEYALDIERNNALIVSMSEQLGMTSEQVDDLFKLAATL